MNIRDKYTKNCISCIPVQDEIYRVILVTKLARIVLRMDDQGPIGRCVYVPFLHIPNLEDLSDEIWLEAKLYAGKIYRCLKSLYGASKYALCVIGNLTKDENGTITDDPLYEHRHLHIVPSYKDPIHAHGLEFIDDNYGKPLNFDSQRGYKKMPIDKNIAMKIRDNMRQWLLDHKEIDLTNIP